VRLQQFTLFNTPCRYSSYYRLESAVTMLADSRLWLHIEMEERREVSGVPASAGCIDLPQHMVAATHTQAFIPRLRCCLTPTRAAIEATETYRQTHSLGRGGGVTNGWDFWKPKT